jgi:hypothetical protein
MNHTLKFIAAWALCTVIRLIPFRPPNFEPILATAMPFARRMGPLVGFLFAALNMVAFDVITGKVGMWTLVTATTYGVIGALAPLFFSRAKANVTGYIGFGIIGTLLFDGITGVLMGPLLFGGSFVTAFVGQIPFTLNHLLGVVVFSAVLSPIVDRWIVSNPRLALNWKPA